MLESEAFLFAVARVFAFGGLRVDLLLFSSFCERSSRWAQTFCLDAESMQRNQEGIIGQPHMAGASPRFLLPTRLQKLNFLLPKNLVIWFLPLPVNSKYPSEPFGNCKGK